MDKTSDGGIGFSLVIAAFGDIVRGTSFVNGYDDAIACGDDLYGYRLNS